MSSVLKSHSVGNDIKLYARSELFDVDRHVRYYGELASKYQKLHSRIQLAVFVLSLAVPTLLAIFPDISVLAPVGLLLAALVGWDFIGGHANKAAVLHGISTDCDRIKSEQMELYQLIKNDRISETDAQRRLDALGQRTIEATGRAGYAQVSIDQHLLDRCASDTNQVLLVEEERCA